MFDHHDPVPFCLGRKGGLRQLFQDQPQTPSAISRIEICPHKETDPAYCRVRKKLLRFAMLVYQPVSAPLPMSLTKVLPADILFTTTPNLCPEADTVATEY